MKRAAPLLLCLFAAGMIGLGILGLVAGDFALQWQPVAPWFPGRTVLAYVAALVSLLGGAGLLVERTRAWSARVLFAYLVVWLLLKVPSLVVAPGMEAVWLGAGEIGMLLAGGWAAAATYGELRGGLGGERGLRAARLLFGVAVLPVGLSHIFYVKQTMALIPAWLPGKMGWAYLTGAGQMACGLGVLAGTLLGWRLLTRIAAFCEAGMVGCFALLLWAPAVAATRSRLSWTAFWITWAIGAAAGMVGGPD